MSSDPISTYAGGIDGLLKQMEGRRDPMSFAEGEALPGLDADLVELAEARVPPPEEDPLRAIKPVSDNHRKFLDLRAELAGHSELAVLHGLLIAHLRKRSQPAHTAALFHRLWAEHASHLLSELNPRWLVSAITTFGEHGLTAGQRTLGHAMSVLFNTMKLYESERRYSGLGSDTPFTLKGRNKGPLPMEMDAFAITGGGLDVNMIGRLWLDADKDTVIQPLAHELLIQLTNDPRSVFRRLRIMRRQLERRRAMAGALRPVADGERVIPENIAPVGFVPARRSGTLTWAAVTTTNAPLPDIAAWAAHYLELGADHLYVYLDAPNSDAAAILGAHPQISVQTCDSAYWARYDKARPAAHQLRQSFNATQCYQKCQEHFLGHFDVDEFVISASPVFRALDFVPKDAAYARARPVELLAPIDGQGARHFKRSHRQAGQSRDVLEELYPNFGPYLSGGFISHTTGKVFARTGIADTRLGIHTLKYKGEEASNRTELPKMAIAHCHARDFAHFRDRAQFRLDKGSYRKRDDKEDMGLSDVLSFLLREEGEAGLETFFTEVCTAQPDLLQALEARGMLMTHDLDLEAKVARVFGPLPLPKAGAA